MAELERLVANPALHRMRVGVAVRDLVTGKSLFEHNADALYATAFEQQGDHDRRGPGAPRPSFHFQTTISAVGRIRTDGVLEGNLVVVGRGDPRHLGRFNDGNPTAILDAWVQAVADAGIRTVRGDLIADDTYFDRQAQHPNWPHGQELNWYSARPSARSRTTTIASRSSWGPARREPRRSSPSRRPHTTSRSPTPARPTPPQQRGNDVLVRHRAGKNAIAVSGEINPGHHTFQTSVTIDHPRSISPPSSAKCSRPRESPWAGGLASVCRATTSSRPTRATSSRPPRPCGPPSASPTGTARTSTPSRILKTIGHEQRGEGSWAAGAEAVTAFLRDIGIQGEFTYVDGSGLASTNRFAPSQIVDLLGYMNGRRAGGVYLHSLAEPGSPGRSSATSSRSKAGSSPRQATSPTSPAFRATSSARRGHLLAFSILINDLHGVLGDAKNTENEICVRLADYEP